MKLFLKGIICLSLLMIGNMVGFAKSSNHAFEIKKEIVSVEVSHDSFVTSTVVDEVNVFCVESSIINLNSKSNSPAGSLFVDLYDPITIYRPYKWKLNPDNPSKVFSYKIHRELYNQKLESFKHKSLKNLRIKAWC